jgi:hypothetical protein
VLWTPANLSAVPDIDLDVAHPRAERAPRELRHRLDHERLIFAGLEELMFRRSSLRECFTCETFAWEGCARRGAGLDRASAARPACSGDPKAAVIRRSYGRAGSSRERGDDARR